MKVCIAEKPSVAREIANVLGAKSRKDGYFEGNGYQVTWTFGHFCTLLPPEDYQASWKRWDLNTLPMLPEKFETKIMNDSGVKKQFKIIKSLFAKAAVVINCGDAGTEGELIQRWVIKQAKYKGPVERLWISSLTTEAIKAGFQKLQPGSNFDNLYFAGSSRAIGDWLLGMNATRLYTLKYGGYKQVLSVGRVQTPTLAMLVQRHHEIENFKPEPYWELQTIYRETTFSHVSGRFQKQEEGSDLLALVQGKDITVKSVEKKEGKEYAPKLFDLTGLQVYCNTRFGFSADRTLKLVQKLYEMKVVSYPRVDTTFLPNDQYPKIPGILKGLANYSKFTNQILGKKIRKSAKVFNDKKVTDHHAIIPTGEEKSISADEQKVYDAIVRRFIAVFFPDCLVSKTKVTGVVMEEEFIANGKEVLKEGWRVLFPPKKKKNSDDDDNAEEDNLLPTFVVGESGPHVPSLTEKSTKPPKNFTEATLLRAMETAGKQVDDEELRDLMKANGIGRPSTRASIIETLFRRKYTKRQKKLVLPTQMGIELIGTIQNELLKSAELTGQWEKKLKEIEDGEYSAKQFIINMKKMVDDLVTEVRMESGKNRLAAAPSPYSKSKYKGAANSSAKKPTRKSTTSKAKSIADIPCPVCHQGKLIKGKASYGCTRWQSGCTLRLPFTFMGKKISDTQIRRLLEKGSTTKLKGFKDGKLKVDGTLTFDPATGITFKNSATKTTPKPASKESKPPCPSCKVGSIVQGKTAYGCSNWKAGCNFRYEFAKLKATAAGRPLTKELVLKIISQGL